MEYRNFALNEKGKSHLIYGVSTKMRETLDYRIKLKQGFYEFIEKADSTNYKSTSE